MSMLLDALRKSEERRQLGETPTLQTQVDGGEPAGSGVPVWLTPATMAAAVLVMAWIGWAQYRQPEARVMTTQAQGSDRQESIAAAVPPTGIESAAPVPRPDPAERGTQRSGTEPRAPVSQPPGKENDSTARKKQLGVSFQSYSGDQPPAAAPGSVKRRSISSPPSPDDVPVSSATPTAQVVAEVPQSASDGIAALETLSYWQMPPSLREGMPELKMTVLVYAEDPASRFLLLNGQRLHEKDEIENGLVLEEIQRDRAIFSYRNYIFYLKS